MADVLLEGLDGSNPLAFLAAIGLSRVAERPLSWAERGGFRAVLHDVASLDSIIDVVQEDVARWSASSPLAAWRYLKKEKQGVKLFRGLKMPLGVYREWVRDRLAADDTEALAYAASFVSECSGDVIERTKQVDADEYNGQAIPIEDAGNLAQTVALTFFDFTSRNKQFVDQAETILAKVSRTSIQDALTGTRESRPCDLTMGWDPAQDAPGALFPRGVPPFRPAMEWLAFRGLPLLPTFDTRFGVGTTGCTGRRKAGAFYWPMWSPSLNAKVIRSLLRCPSLERTRPTERAAMGVTAVFSSELAKAADGYEGIFSPSTPV